MLRVVFDFAQIKELIWGKERVGSTRFACAACASDSMDVVLGGVGHSEVDDIAHIGDIDAAR